MTLRFKNTRTGREVAAKSGRDLAAMVKIEQDRRSGLEVAEAVKQTATEALRRSPSGEVFAETDPENWPSGRPTQGRGR